MKSAQNQAGAATTTASNTGANYGQAAAGVNSNLVPFETQQLLHPMGYSPQDQSAMLAAGMGGAGGATSAVAGQAAQQAAQSGNASGFTANLDAAARDRAKASAGSAEGIAAGNAGVKLQQQQQAAGALGDISKQDTSAQIAAMGQVPEDINANANAGKSGWLQNVTGIMGALGGAGSGGAAAWNAYKGN